MVNDDPARAAGLIAVAEELAGEFSLRPLLEQILRRCTELLGCDAGSICSVDEAAGIYRKEADIGVACHSGAGLSPHRGHDRGGRRPPGPALVRPVRRRTRRARGPGVAGHACAA